jgi:hypothetical protein
VVTFVRRRGHLGDGIDLKSSSVGDIALFEGVPVTV